MQATNRDAALSLVSQGLHIFPCNPDKTPMVAAWEQSAINSPFAVGIKWDASPNALPAIPVRAHGIVVIDCDRKQAGIDGVAAFHALCANHRIDLSGAFVVETPSTGLHFYFLANAPYGNSRGSLPDGIDVRGIGGFVIAPGATLPDGRRYRIVAGSWDAMPPLPDALAAFLKEKRPATAPEPSPSHTEAVTDRESAYAENAMADECAALASMRPGQGRNAALNQASHSIGTMVGAGWIERERAEQALWEAAEQNQYRAKDGDSEAWKTLQSGLESGMSKPRDPLPDADVPQWVRETVANLLAAHKAKQPVVAANPVGKRSVTLVPFSQIEAQPITWLWHGYLPQGKLSLLAGAGGTGKSTIAFSLAGTITNGGLWPDGSQCRNAGNVLIWSSEDDAADTIAPRLLAVGANVNRCGIVQGTTDEHGISSPFDASRDVDALRDAVNRIGGISMLVIDPIVSAVVGDMHKANDVRRSLQTIVDFAAEMNCAVLGISHFAKNTAGKNSAERVIGSQAFAALARMVLVAAKEEESNRRVFTRAKSNNSVDTGGFSYSIEAINLHNGIEATRVEWGEALEGSSRSILAQVEGEPSEDVSQLGVAKQFLIESLRNGPVASKELMEHAREGYNVSNNTLRRAQKELGIVAAKVAFAGGWMWSLPLANPSQLSR
jgi:putative DNA primase/helicase